MTTVDYSIIDNCLPAALEGVSAALQARYGAQMRAELGKRIHRLTTQNHTMPKMGTTPVYVQELRFGNLELYFVLLDEAQASEYLLGLIRRLEACFEADPNAAIVLDAGRWGTLRCVVLERIPGLEDPETLCQQHPRADAQRIAASAISWRALGFDISDLGLKEGNVVPRLHPRIFFDPASACDASSIVCGLVRGAASILLESTVSRDVDIMQTGALVAFHLLTGDVTRELPKIDVSGPYAADVRELLAAQKTFKRFIRAQMSSNGTWTAPPAVVLDDAMLQMVSKLLAGDFESLDAAASALERC